jgi:hypothetical protein
MKYRQGDILLERIGDLPYGLEVKLSGRINVGNGEVTGHTHVLQNALWLAEATEDINRLNDFAENGGDPVYVVVTEETKFTHQEHATLFIEPGNYRVVRQREYTPVAPRFVLD